MNVNINKTVTLVVDLSADVKAILAKVATALGADDPELANQIEEIKSKLEASTNNLSQILKESL